MAGTRTRLCWVCLAALYALCHARARPGGGVCGDGVLDEGEQCELCPFARGSWPPGCSPNCTCAQGYIVHDAQCLLQASCHMYVYSDASCSSTSVRAVVGDVVDSGGCSEVVCSRDASPGVPHWSTVLCGQSAVFPEPSSLPRGFHVAVALAPSSASAGDVLETWVASGLCPLALPKAVTCLGQNEVVEQYLSGCAPAGPPLRRLLSGPPTAAGSASRVLEECVSPGALCGNAYVEGDEECDGGRGCDSATCTCMPFWVPAMPRLAGCVLLESAPAMEAVYAGTQCSGAPIRVLVSDSPPGGSAGEGSNSNCLYRPEANETVMASYGRMPKLYGPGVLCEHFAGQDRASALRVSWSTSLPSAADSTPGMQSECASVAERADVTLCGNNVSDPGEECDGGAACDPLCRCPRRSLSSSGGRHYSPKRPRAVACGYCGDGVVDLAEQCDGGDGCSERCLCNERTHVPSRAGGLPHCERAVAAALQYYDNSECHGVPVAARWHTSFPANECDLLCSPYGPYWQKTACSTSEEEKGTLGELPEHGLVAVEVGGGCEHGTRSRYTVRLQGVCFDGTIVSCNASHVSEYSYKEPLRQRRCRGGRGV
eukprot:m51a1_g6032 hypothetical protein (599) ;mRNA; f:121811-124090